ncbi:MAG: holo-ACP synthase [Calditrichia bacterium]
MIKGIGTDIIEISRINDLISKYGDNFLNKVFTAREIDYCQKKVTVESFAVRFAAKEACFKALGTGLRDGLTWKDFEILNDHQGKPVVHIHNKARDLIKSTKIHISLSHNRSQAIAFVIFEIN